MFEFNKLIGYLISPSGAALALLGAVVIVRIAGPKRALRVAVALAFAHIWLWSMPIGVKWIGATLESEFLVNGRVPEVASLPQADLIELHGGGMGVETNISSYAEMWGGADRTWHATRLWKAGKAPKILVTSGWTDLSSGTLLADLGVPKEAIVYDFAPRNTEEEAKAVAVHCSTSTLNFASARPKVLVVTSAWHMKRTMLMYQKYAPNVEAIPAPCDFENTITSRGDFGWRSILPDPMAFSVNSAAFHEWLGYFGYKYFR